MNGAGKRIATIAKRVIDVALASTGMVASAPLCGALALAIRLESRGPVIFRQRRAGRLLGRDADGRLRFEEITVLKLRTMRADAEATSGAVLAVARDPRVTRVGRVLRKTRLDELPQLWNVLRGDMSIVGPRPERPELLTAIARAIPFFEERMRGVAPGITGLAQVSLGYSGAPPEGAPIGELLPSLVNPYDVPEAEGADADDLRVKLLYDLAYVATFERPLALLRTDLAILARTPLVMLRGVGR